MSRPMSLAALRAVFAQETDALFPVLLEITHGVAGFANPLRICNHETPLLYQGATYEAFPFRYDLPDQLEDGSIQNARLTICAVDQSIAMILRSTQVPPTVRAVATFYDETSFEPIASWALTVRNVSGNAETISADLIFEDRLDNETPGMEFRPALYPGAF